jgi:2,3-bisphosphoglycerate-independent phosphoglycerate mutase
MKSLLIIIDGLGDDQVPALGYKTPFDYAKHENIDNIAAMGIKGNVDICGNEFIPESLKCILRLLGVQSKDFPTNRAYLELLAENRDITQEQMVLRCNLVSVDETGMLTSFNGEGLTRAEQAEAAAICDESLSKIEFLHLSEYRNLLITPRNNDFIANIVIKPPHESVGENIGDLLGDLRKRSSMLVGFLEQARLKLRKFEKNGIHYELYPWGVSVKTVMDSFSQRHFGMKGAAVCSAEIVKGIAFTLKMEAPKMVSATGETDTDLKEKAAVTTQMLKTNDFVMTHFNGSDEAAHRKNHHEKAEFITRIDEEFLAAVLSNITEATKVFICGDHGTSSVTGKHLAAPVPFVAGIVGGAGVIPSIKTYSDIWSFLYERGSK